MTKKVINEKNILQKLHIYVLILVFTLLCITGPSVKAEGSKVKKVDGNLIKITTEKDFKSGTLTNTEIDTTVGDGAIKLTAGSTDGEYLSPVYQMQNFDTLVASWNCDAPEGTYIEVQAKAYCDKDKEWTNWVSWGKWGFFMQRSCADTRDTLAYVDTDTLTIRGNEGESASKIQFKVLLHTDDATVTPVVREICGTYKYSVEGKEIEPKYVEEKVELPDKVLLDTPAYSQMIRDFDLAGSICSPTTITTLLNDRGEDLLPEEVALNTYDFQYQGFGNWSFSVASAGGYGYEAYVQYANMDIIYQELAKGYSVGISVHYSDKESGSEPYVEGAPLTTNGHLITLRGYETIDGVKYIYVSDSAAGSDSASLLKYRADQLEAAWNGIAYIVHDKEKNAGGNAIKRYDAELRKVDGTSDEYELYVDGNKVELDSKFISKKLVEPGCGTVTYIDSDAVPAMAAQPAKTTLANSSFGYECSVKTSTGNISLNPDNIIMNAKEGDTKNLTVYIISNTGKVYVAPVTISKAEPTAAVTATPTPAVKQASTTNAKVTKNSSPVWVYIVVIVGILLVAGIAVILLKTKKNSRK